MKILIDIDELELKGVVTPQLASTLRTHAIRNTGSTAINMLLAFGAIAIATGLLSLFPSSEFAAFFGAVFILLGWFVRRQYKEQWGALGNIWMITGALVLSGSLGAITDEPMLGPIIAAVILTFVSVIAESNLLISLVPLSLLAAIGGSTGYWHACYAISIQEPTITIVLFTALAYGAFQISKSQTGIYQALSIVFARMSVILVNFGFWIGSLWGDTPGKIWSDPIAIRYYSDVNQQIPDMVFIVGWAAALIMAGAWGAKQGRRFMVNTVAVFGAIHFYTQWFEYLGLHAESVIVAGVATVALGLGLLRYNREALAK